MSAANREREPGSARARTDVRNCLSAIACMATAEAGGPVHFVPGLVVTSFLGTALGTQPEALVDLKPIGKITKNTLYFDKNTQVHTLQ